MRTLGVIAIITILSTQAVAHSGGLNKQGCHAGSQPYHCHKSAKVEPLASSNSTILSGTVTHVRDGDTIEVNGVAVRLSALDCPDNNTRQGKQASKQQRLPRNLTAHKLCVNSQVQSPTTDWLVTAQLVALTLDST